MKIHTYLDFNATTPPDAEILDQIPSWAAEWGNPSSIHWAGRGPKVLIRKARESVAKMLGCNPLEIVFTSGGSEANNLAILGSLAALANQGSIRRKILVSAVEHPSVMKTVLQLGAQGYIVKTIPVFRTGHLDMEIFESELNEEVALVCVMVANNETGNVFPVKKIAEACHKVGALLHSDAVQTIGKLPLFLQSWNLDMASFSGHKFYALKGCGVLYVKKGTPMSSHIFGGPQERKRRAGTENSLAIAAFGTMAEKSAVLLDAVEDVKRLRDWMESEILRRIDNVSVTGNGNHRLPNTSSMVLPEVDGETLLMNLDLNGFAVSTGAACSSGSPEPSPVLLNMGLSREEAQCSLRVSLGWKTTEAEIRSFIEVLVEVVERLRRIRRTGSASLNPEGEARDI